MVNAIYGGAESVQNLIELGKEASRDEAGTYVEAASTTNENALMYQAPYYTETNRGLVPEYDNLFNVASWEGWLTYDAVAGAPEQDKPVLLVGSEAMALPGGTHEYLQRAGDNVSVVWLDSVTQFDFYDVSEVVKTASEAVAEHFRKYTC